MEAWHSGRSIASGRSTSIASGQQYKPPCRLFLTDCSASDGRRHLDSTSQLPMADSPIDGWLALAILRLQKCKLCPRANTGILYQWSLVVARSARSSSMSIETRDNAAAVLDVPPMQGWWPPPSSARPDHAQGIIVRETLLKLVHLLLFSAVTTYILSSVSSDTHGQPAHHA